MRIVKNILGPLYETAITYPAPSNLNYNYNYGVYAFMVLIIQIIRYFSCNVYCPSASVHF